MTWPNLSEDFFELGRWASDRNAAVVEAFIEFDRSVNNMDGGNFEYERCAARSKSGDWLCNWRARHTGHHDAWMEGEGTHVAHWWNENAHFIIREELEFA